MDSVDTSSFEGVLTHAQPLGPIDHLGIQNDVASHKLLVEEVGPFAIVGSNPYTLLLGRKGSGKSAILTEIRMNLKPGWRRLQIPEQLPEKGEPYILPILSWEQFHQIVRNVAADSNTNDLFADLVPAEFYAQLWQEKLWEEIIQHFANYWHFPAAHGALDPVRDYVEGNGTYEGSPEQEARRRFEAARRSILDFLSQRRSHLYFLFDSMENYPVRHPLFSRVLTGLFQALHAIDAESPYIKVSFCIPEELENFLTGNSANLAKDFASSYRIRWRPIDLLRIVAHRFRLAMAVHDREFYDELEELNFSRREDIHVLFSRILPRAVTNALGDPEDPLAYIIRHTQLLPRHVLMIFNAILSRNYGATGRFRRIEESAIREGIVHVQKIIEMQVLNPYERLYPKLITTCRKVLPELNPICSHRDLMVTERRFRDVEDDITSVWHTLFQMGVLGRVEQATYEEEPPVQGEQATHAEGGYARRKTRYGYGHFHYNIDGEFTLISQCEYCFHPVFSRAFGMIRPDNEKRVVYPANVDMLTIT